MTNTINKKFFLTAAAVGASAGFVNGFLGTGGGIVIIFTLGLLQAAAGEREIFQKEDKKGRFAFSVTAMLPVSAVSAVSYIARGALPSFSELAGGLYAVIIPAALGGIAGALLLDRITAAVLNKIFAALVIWAGISMIF